LEAFGKNGEFVLDFGQIGKLGVKISLIVLEMFDLLFFHPQ
jgi:hypothetical protein